MNMWKIKHSVDKIKMPDDMRERIIANCEAKMKNAPQTTGEFTDKVDTVERYRPQPWKKGLAAAAIAALVFSGGGLAVYNLKHGISAQPPAVSDTEQIAQNAEDYPFADMLSGEFLCTLSADGIDGFTLGGASRTEVSSYICKTAKLEPIGTDWNGRSYNVEAFTETLLTFRRESAVGSEVLKFVSDGSSDTIIMQYYRYETADSDKAVNEAHYIFADSADFTELMGIIKRAVDRDSLPVWFSDFFAADTVKFDSVTLSNEQISAVKEAFAQQGLLAREFNYMVSVDSTDDVSNEKPHYQEFCDRVSLGGMCPIDVEHFSFRNDSQDSYDQIHIYGDGMLMLYNTATLEAICYEIRYDELMSRLNSAIYAPILADKVAATEPVSDTASVNSEPTVQPKENDVIKPTDDIEIKNIVIAGDKVYVAKDEAYTDYLESIYGASFVATADFNAAEPITSEMQKQISDAVKDYVLNYDGEYDLTKYDMSEEPQYTIYFGKAGSGKTAMINCYNNGNVYMADYSDHVEFHSDELISVLNDIFAQEIVVSSN